MLRHTRRCERVADFQPQRPKPRYFCTEFGTAPPVKWLFFFKVQSQQTWSIARLKRTPTSHSEGRRRTLYDPHSCATEALTIPICSSQSAFWSFSFPLCVNARKGRFLGEKRIQIRPAPPLQSHCREEFLEAS